MATPKTPTIQVIQTRINNKQEVIPVVMHGCAPLRDKSTHIPHDKTPITATRKINLKSFGVYKGEIYL
jgi:hypothetical protein